MGSYFTKRRMIIIALATAFFLWIGLDAMGTFNNLPYFEVPHGNHTHFVPKSCDPPLPVSQAPTQRPGPEQMVSCTGQIVPYVP
jgi:hypothetical protein